MNSAGGRLVFAEDPKINVEQLLLLIQTQAHCYKFDGKDKFKFVQTFTSTDEKLEFVSGLLEKLTVQNEG